MDKVKNYIIFNLLYLSFGIVSLFLVSNAWPVLFFWIFITLGNGVAGHRYLCHNQFKVHPWLHWPMMLWCTLAAYSTTMFWFVQHRHHHRHSDKADDIHCPKHGLANALFLWPFTRERIEHVFKDQASLVNLARCMRDPAVNFTTKYFIPLNLIFLITLGIIDLNLLYCMAIAFCIEFVKLGLINTVTHIESLPGNYRNHDTKDNSQNNLLLGFLTLGFGWHNNHHADASKLILTERWWEIDPEGYVGYILSLTSRGNK